MIEAETRLSVIGDVISDQKVAIERKAQLTGLTYWGCDIIVTAPVQFNRVTFEEGRLYLKIPCVFKDCHFSQMTLRGLEGSVFVTSAYFHGCVWNTAAPNDIHALIDKLRHAAKNKWAYSSVVEQLDPTTLLTVQEVLNTLQYFGHKAYKWGCEVLRKELEVYD
jgi:hypothetical protein